MQTFDGARRHRLGASGKEAGGSCVVRRVRCRVSTFRHKARRALRERGLTLRVVVFHDPNTRSKRVDVEMGSRREK